MVMNVYVVHEDNETARLSWQGSGRDQAVFGVDAVNPNHGVADRYLGVDRPTAGISV